jgi:hypothetical protein
VTARRATLLGLTITGAILAVVEVRALADVQEDDTISEIIADVTRVQPLATIAVGACAAHFAGGSPRLQNWMGKHPLAALGLGLGVGLAWPLRGLKRA